MTGTWCGHLTWSVEVQNKRSYTSTYPLYLHDTYSYWHADCHVRSPCLLTVSKTKNSVVIRAAHFDIPNAKIHICHIYQVQMHLFIIEFLFTFYKCFHLVTAYIFFLDFRYFIERTKYIWPNYKYFATNVFISWALHSKSLEIRYVFPIFADILWS